METGLIGAFVLMDDEDFPLGVILAVTESEDRTILTLLGERGRLRRVDAADVVLAGAPKDSPAEIALRSYPMVRDQIAEHAKSGEDTMSFKVEVPPVD